MAESELLLRLSLRVRERRQAQAMTLRELAKRSGVSERFLVLLEGGRANVSVTKLDDVARALDTTPAELLEDGDRELFDSPHALGPLIALLGLRGAGKSAIGQRVAERLRMPFIELDSVVVSRAGMSLGELFELHGSGYYRRLERQELDSILLGGTSSIVATGGSLVTEPQTFERLRRSAVTVWLRATAEDHWNRVVAQGDARPMQNRTDAMKELRGLLRARRPLYEQAEFVVDTSALGLDRAVNQVVKIARDARSEARRGSTRPAR